MARPLRIEYPGAFYHVTCRGNERREIFADDRDRKRFLEILAESKEIYGVEVHGYVVMANHFHLMVMTPEANLQKFMQRFNTSYTVYFNRRHRRSGHLYQGRYKAILVDADNYWS
jgi:REP element-mobilizing transposase RayT